MIDLDGKRIGNGRNVQADREKLLPYLMSKTRDLQCGIVNYLKCFEGPTVKSRKLNSLALSSLNVLMNLLVESRFFLQFRKS
jgi:hypothetical protein